MLLVWLSSCRSLTPSKTTAPPLSRMMSLPLLSLATWYSWSPSLLKRQIATRLDLGAHLSRAGDFICLRFFRTPASLLLHVIQRMRTVLRRQQVQLIPAVQIRLVPRTDLARHQCGVAPGLALKVRARRQHTGQLRGLLVRRLDAFFAVFFFAFDVVHVADGGDVEVASGLNVQVLTGSGGAANNVDVLPGLHVDVAARRDARGKVFDIGGDGGFFAAVDGFVYHAGVAGGDQVEVAPGGEGGVVAGDQCAVVVEVASGFNGQVATRGDGARAGVGEGAHAHAFTHLDGSVVVGDVAFDAGKADLAATNFTAHGVADAVLGQQAQVVAGFHQAAGVKAATADGGEVVAGAQGADVNQVATGDEVEVTALDQAVAAHVARFGLGQVEHRHQDSLAIDHAVFHPHDVVGQGADLLAGERHTDAQAQDVFAGEGVVHQVAELVGVAVEAAGKEALAGLREHGVTDQAALVLAITQTAPGVVIGEAEFAEHVVGTEEARGGGKFRIGLDQVVAGRVGFFDEQAVLALGQLEVRGGSGVDRGERRACVVHGDEAAAGGDGGNRQYAAGGLGARIVGVFAQVDVDAADRDAGLVVAKSASQLSQGVVMQRAVLQGARDV